MVVTRLGSPHITEGSGWLPLLEVLLAEIEGLRPESQAEKKEEAEKKRVPTGIID